jgi:hypothetical protein
MRRRWVEGDKRIIGDNRDGVQFLSYALVFLCPDSKCFCKSPIISKIYYMWFDKPKRLVFLYIYKSKVVKFIDTESTFLVKGLWLRRHHRRNPPWDCAIGRSYAT